MNINEIYTEATSLPPSPEEVEKQKTTEKEKQFIADLTRQQKVTWLQNPATIKLRAELQSRLSDLDEQIVNMAHNEFTSEADSKIRGLIIQKSTIQSIINENLI